MLKKFAAYVLVWLSLIASPGLLFAMPQQLSQGNPDGVQLGQSATDKVGFYGTNPLAQRSMSVQQMLHQSASGGEVVIYQITWSPSAVSANTCAEQTVTVTGVATTDLIYINKPTTQAGLSIAGTRASASNQIGVDFCNNTGGSITPTGSEVYTVMTIKGLGNFTYSLTPTAVAANSISEQQFTIGPTTAAAATATINSSGQVVSVKVTTAGAGYTTPPTITFTTPSFGTGSSGLGTQNPGMITTPGPGGAINPGPSSPFTVAPLSVGNGASAVAVLDGSGGIQSINITNSGKGYLTAPTVSISDGTMLNPGMLLQVNKPTVQAGLGVAGARVCGNDIVCVTFVNVTASPITPTAAESYTFNGLLGLQPINHFLQYGVNVGTLSGVATVTCAEQTVTLNGLLATDFSFGLQKPTAQAGLGLVNDRVTAANTIGLNFCNPTAGTVTPTASEVYGVGIFRQAPTAPMVVYSPVLTPASVAANTTAEQTFTVTGVPVSSSCSINKQSATTGLFIGGCRVSAANTIAITFGNTTGSAITPPSEQYIIGNFQHVGPGTGNYVAQAASPIMAGLYNLATELQALMVNLGLMKGF